jgi:hypothetical protein
VRRKQIFPFYVSRPQSHVYCTIMCLAKSPIEASLGYRFLVFSGFVARRWSLLEPVGATHICLYRTDLLSFVLTSLTSLPCWNNKYRVCWLGSVPRSLKQKRKKLWRPTYWAATSLGVTRVRNVLGSHLLMQHLPRHGVYHNTVERLG